MYVLNYELNSETPKIIKMQTDLELIRTLVELNLLKKSDITIELDDDGWIKSSIYDDFLLDEDCAILQYNKSIYSDVPNFKSLVIYEIPKTKLDSEYITIVRQIEQKLVDEILKLQFEGYQNYDKEFLQSMYLEFEKLNDNNKFEGIEMKENVKDITYLFDELEELYEEIDEYEAGL